ncbi:single-stranded DNA-binding protein [Thiobacillus sp. 65-1402]|mgnify:CR=1 FL=1|uniref:single-stranded DNA-binding protein n=1 Tax=Thiobacillus sp. 65-1402 TaxID=1895861 RepID=UPI00095DAC4D|nr:single-stranded DNA-binding protein [Thiobacillus sp. 65-1402]OJW81599.1 MAG: hypothetical protein BGO62_15485 [Thiobacillus sp. 65-1402]
MQITIDVNSQKTAIKRGTAKATGKPYEIITQRGHLHQADTITGEISLIPIDITLEPNAFPYDTGRYTIDASSLIVGQYGGLSIGRLKLFKLPAQAVNKAAA